MPWQRSSRGHRSGATADDHRERQHQPPEQQAAAMSRGPQDSRAPGGAGAAGVSVTASVPFYAPPVMSVPGIPHLTVNHGHVASPGYFQDFSPHQHQPYGLPHTYLPTQPGLYPVPPNPPPPSDEYYLNMAIEQSLAEANRHPQRSMAAPTSARDVSTKGQAEAQSYKYWTTGCLSYAETVLDGFYMTDDQFPELCDKDQFPKLEPLKSVSVAEDDPREVIHVDHKQDGILDQLRDRAREAVNACAQQPQGSLPKIQALAKIVSEYFGGSFDTEDALSHAWRQTSSSEKKFKGSVVILLGRLRGGGAARHRALLFKMLADSQSIKCQLLNGRNFGRTDDMAMVQVVVAGKYCILDLVHEPGRLIPCDELQGQGQGPRLLSVSTSSDPISAPFIYTPTGCHRPKAHSESNLHANPAPAPQRVSQLAVPDLIRLDSGPLAETADCSWAKFPNPCPGPAMAGSASVPPEATAAPAATVHAEVAGPSPSGHHGHSHSFDVSAFAAAGFSSQVDLQRHSHSPEHAAQQQKPPISSPFANVAGSQAVLPPQPSTQQPSSQSSSQSGGTLPAAAAPLPHWALAAATQQPGPAPQAQGSSAAFFAAAGRGPPPIANGHMGASTMSMSALVPPTSRPKLMQQQQQQQQLGNGLKTSAGKNYGAEANEPFADLSPFKSVPLLAGSVPTTSYLNQQQRPQQQQAAGAGPAPAHVPTPRRHTDNPPVPDVGAGAAMQQQQQQLGKHAKNGSNGSVGSWDMVADFAPGAGPGQPGAGGPPHPPGHSGSSPAADGASLAAPQPGGMRHTSPFEAAAAAFAPGMGHSGSMAMPPGSYGSGAGPGPGASPWGQAQQHSQLPPSPSPHAGVASGAMQHEQQQQQQQHASPDMNSLGHPGPRLMGLRQDELATRMPSLHLGHNKDWEINPMDLKVLACIGRGSYGEVFKGEWLKTDVAIKKFLPGVGEALSKTVVKEFKAEVSIMHTLKHPNIVMFMGAVVQPDQLAIVTQFIPRGSLSHLLHLCPTCHRVDINPKRRLAFARDIAKGMHYLHSCSPPIAHRDLKPANLLVDKDWTVKVCDFGLSQVKRAAFLTAKTEMRGTTEWMAPEVLRSDECTEKCDLYSYGVILYELVTGDRPWSHVHNGAQVIGLVGYKQQRLELPTDLQPEVFRLVNDCWREAPAERPSFAEVLDRLACLKDEGLVPSPSRMAASRDEDNSNCSHH